MHSVISTTRHDFNSVIVLHGQMETLDEQLEVLKVGLTKSKAHCRTALDKNGIETEFVDAMIKKAESQKPKKKNPHLKRVHRSWEKVQEKMKEIQSARDAE